MFRRLFVRIKKRIKELIDYMSKTFNKDILLQGISNQQSSEWGKLEQILLTTTLATLAASATFLTGKGGTYAHRGVLGTSWILLCASLVSLMLSYAFSEYFTKTLISRVKKQPNVVVEEDFEKLKSKGAMLGITITNYLALACTIFGIIVLVIFAYLNLS
jgi:hypothetical protein